MIFLAKEKSVYAEKKLLVYLQDKAVLKDGKRFEKIDIAKIIDEQRSQIYCFNDVKEVDETVAIVVGFIMDKNYIISNVKEFLVTTIGEVFSNAFNHSEEQSVYFSYDIELLKGTLFLVINITDYGKTIVNSVRTFLQDTQHIVMESCECMKWSIQAGNTTRDGSGGYGLSMLKDYVGEVNGELMIFSGDGGCVLEKAEIRFFENKGYFYGTSVSMKIPLFDTSRIVSYDEERKKIVSIGLEEV